jgi:hypothetical protein
MMKVSGPIVSVHNFSSKDVTWIYSKISSFLLLVGRMLAVNNSFNFNSFKKLIFSLMEATHEILHLYKVMYSNKKTLGYTHEFYFNY